MINRLTFVGAVVAFLAAASIPVDAQKYEFVGRAKCVNCHDHDNEKLWSEKKDGPPPNNHLNALKQMETEKSTAFAAAIGVKDVYDLGSPCVKCHATVVKGDISGGVTCETCHGAGSGYLEPHQKKDAYPQAVATGLVDSVKKSNNWAVMCMTCHTMDDARLIAAKHPSGDDFDLGAKFTVVATGHWKSTYDKAAITALGKAAAAKIVASRRGGAAPAAQPVSSAAPPSSPAPPAPSAPAPVAAAQEATPVASAAPSSAPASPLASASTPPTSSAAAPPAASPATAPPATPSPRAADVKAPAQTAPPPAASPASAPAAATTAATEATPSAAASPPPASVPSGGSASAKDTQYTPPVATEVQLQGSVSGWVWVAIPVIVIGIGAAWYSMRRRSR